MTNTTNLRNLDGRARPQPETPCPRCRREVTQLRQTTVYGKPILACCKCYGMYQTTDTDIAVEQRLAAFAAEWAAYERKSIYLASPFKFRALDALTDAILSRPIPPKPKPPKVAPVVEAWELLIDHVLDAATVVNRLEVQLVPVAELSDIERAAWQREQRKQIAEAMKAVAA